MIQWGEMPCSAAGDWDYWQCNPPAAAAFIITRRVCWLLVRYCHDIVTAIARAIVIPNRTAGVRSFIVIIPWSSNDSDWIRTVQVGGDMGLVRTQATVAAHCE